MAELRCGYVIYKMRVYWNDIISFRPMKFDAGFVHFITFDETAQKWDSTRTNNEWMGSIHIQHLSYGHVYT